MKKIRLLFLTLAALFAGVSAQGKTVYIQPNAWANDNAIISANVWVDGAGGNTWVTLTEVESGILKATFADNFNKMQIVRGPEANKWTNEGAWNITDVLDIVDGKLYQLYDWSGDFNNISVGHGIELVDRGYTVNFNTAIAVPTNNKQAPDFAVSVGWLRKAQSATGDGYGPYYMMYTYSSTLGVGGSGTLGANAQQAPQSSYDGTISKVNDYIVTPKVSGTVTLQVKGNSSANSEYPSQIKFFAIDDDATTVGDEIEAVFSAAISTSDWVTATLTLTESTRLAIKAQWVYMDNFTATSADVPVTPSLTVTKVADVNGNEGTTGTNPIFEQQADGTLKVILKVTLSNTGNVDFVAGSTENYTLTPAQKGNSGSLTYYDEASIAITEDLAAGEIKTIDVEFAVPYVDDFKNWYVRENVTGTTSSSYRYAKSIAYNPVPYFIKKGNEPSFVTSTLTSVTSLDFGMITAETTENYEIFAHNAGDLTIKSITAPAGFSVAPAETLPFTITAHTGMFIDVTADGVATAAGNMVITYVDKDGNDATQEIELSQTVIDASKWVATFDDNAWPANTIHQSSLSIYNNAYSNITYAVTSSYSYSNKFFTPLLAATDGEKFTFDARLSDSSGTIKVYVTKDRNNLGDAILSLSSSQLNTSSFISQEITIAEAGNYYIVFEIYKAYIDNLYGLEKVAVDHDIMVNAYKIGMYAEDKTIQTGTEQSFSLEITTLQDETAEAYSVKLFANNEEVATADAINLTAGTDKTFTLKWTPEVTANTVFETHAEIIFTDNSKVVSPSLNLTVTCEPVFHFVKDLPSNANEPSNYSTPIKFGKVSAAETKTFYIYNWGKAELQVKSITLPEGFTTTLEAPLTVPASTGEALDITISETPGIYSGEMVIVYDDKTGTDREFKLAVSGTMLDATKWFADFGTENNLSGLPAGSIVQANVSATTFATGNASLGSSSSSKNLFITPLFNITQGDVMTFEAKASSGNVKVYLVEDHVAAAATANDEEFAALNPTLVEEFVITENSFVPYSFTLPSTGDFYLAFKMQNAYIDDLYGLTVADVAHDWKIASSNIPTEAMQNVASTATVNILNLGIKDEAAEDITVAVYIDGEAVATAEGIAIPMSHKLTDTGTQQSVTFRSPKAGTFPVYIEVKAGDYSVATEPVYVEFLEEVATAEGIQVGTQTDTGRDYGFVDWYNNDGSTTRYTDILYTATKIEAAGIKAGDKITAISFKASNSAKTFKAAVTSWVGISTGDITYGSPDKAAMAEVSVYNGSVEFPANVESVINLATPIEWDGVSDIRVYTEAVGQGSGNWMAANYAYDSDITMSYNGATKAGPVAYFTLASEPATLSGTVSDGTNAVEGATVTLVSADGDNVQYTGTTNAEGAYSINVIQATREYNVTVTKEGLPDATATVAFGGENQTKDFYMVEPMVVTFVNGANWEKVNAYTYESEQSGTWPGTEISKTGTATIQGVEYDVYTYSLQTPTAPAKIIFNNGNSGDGNQTDNLDFADGEQYVYGITYYSVAGAFRADDASEDVAGIFGTAWATELNDLTKNDEGLYELSFTDVDLAKGTLKFKVVENHAWTTSYPSDNYTVYIAKPGTYSLTITFDANEKSVSHKLYYTLAENNEGIADMADVTVTVERQFKAGWNAVVLPFALTAEEVTEAFGEDSELAVYEGDKNENGAVTVMFKKISDNDKFFSAGYPYMLWLKESVSGLKFTKDISSTLTTAPGTTFDFVGVYEQTDNQDGDYIVQGGEFRKASTANYVLPFRAYLKLKDSQSARSLNFVIGEGGTTTAINAAEIDGLNIEGVYNLNGQKVTNMNRKGLYIINGKKVMVK